MTACDRKAQFGQVAWQRMRVEPCAETDGYAARLASFVIWLEVLMECLSTLNEETDHALGT